MSIREAIKKMECRERECEFLDAKGIYTFCKALFTDNFCKNKDKNNINDKEINKKNDG